jgi:hypothetical protein
VLVYARFVSFCCVRFVSGKALIPQMEVTNVAQIANAYAKIDFEVCESRVLASLQSENRHPAPLNEE